MVKRTPYLAYLINMKNKTKQKAAIFIVIKDEGNIHSLNQTCINELHFGVMTGVYGYITIK